MYVFVVVQRFMIRPYMCIWAFCLHFRACKFKLLRVGVSRLRWRKLLMWRASKSTQWLCTVMLPYLNHSSDLGFSVLRLKAAESDPQPSPHPVLRVDAALFDEVSLQHHSVFLQHLKKKNNKNYQHFLAEITNNFTKASQQLMIVMLHLVCAMMALTICCADCSGAMLCRISWRKRYNISADIQLCTKCSKPLNEITSRHNCSSIRYDENNGERL